MVKGGSLTKHEKSCRSQRHLRIPAVSLSGQDVLKPGDRVEVCMTRWIPAQVHACSARVRACVCACMCVFMCAYILCVCLCSQFCLLTYAE